MRIDFYYKRESRTFIKTQTTKIVNLWHSTIYMSNIFELKMR